MNKIIKTIVLIFAFLFILLIAGGLFAKNWYDNAIYGKDSENLKNIEFVVNEGQSINNVANELEDTGLIKSSTALKIYVKLEKINPNIKPGKYSVPTDLNVPEIISLLEEGKFKPAVWVTIKEGLRYEEVANLLEVELSNTSFDKNEFLNIVANPDIFTFSPEVQEFLNTYKPTGKPLRGFLYPDTYRIDNDQTSLQIIETMVLNLKNKVEKEMQLNNLNLKQGNITNLYDALTLASVIEKEASAWDDRAEISSVFHNRLSEGFLLQSDATVNFITGKNDPGVLFSDTEIDSPYNTYMYTGLTPTPINSPRIESIKAAFYPQQTNYYYFFHTEQGETYFSETFEEHNQKVIQYRGSI